jgi:hypothetical protein
MYSKISSCPKCGAPIYSTSPWFGVTPPPTQHSCNCFYSNYQQYTTDNTVKNHKHDSFYTNNSQEQKIKNGQQALEELFDALEESKRNDLKEATESLRDTFEKNNVLKQPVDPEVLGKELLFKIELLEFNLKTIENGLKHIKDILKKM